MNVIYSVSIKETKQVIKISPDFSTSLLAGFWILPSVRQAQLTYFFFPFTEIDARFFLSKAYCLKSGGQLISMGQFLFILLFYQVPDYGENNENVL